MLHVFGQEEPQAKAGELRKFRILLCLQPEEHPSVQINIRDGADPKHGLYRRGSQDQAAAEPDAVFRKVPGKVPGRGGDAVVEGCFPHLADVHVIVRRRPPDVQLRRSVQEFKTACQNALRQTGGFAEPAGKMCPADQNAFLGLFHLDVRHQMQRRYPAFLMLCLAAGRVLVEGNRVLNGDLVKAQRVSRRLEGICVPERVQDLQEDPALFGNPGGLRRKDDYALRPGRDLRQQQRIDLPGEEDHTVTGKLPTEPDSIVQHGEIHLVPQGQGAVLRFIADGPDRPVDIFKFRQGRVRSAVRRYQTVHAEVPVVGEFSVVAAIEITVTPVGSLSVVYRMIAPFPHKAAADAVILFDQGVIILKIPGAVSHGVTVFAHQKRLVRIRIHIGLHLLQRRIHAAVQVDV